MSLSASVTVQLREYIDPAIGVLKLASTLTMMGGSGNGKVNQFKSIVNVQDSLRTRISSVAVRNIPPTTALHV